MAEEAPAATVTEPGTVRAALLLPMETAVAAAALPLRVMVQELEAPAATVPGEQLREESETGLACTITAAVLETEPRVADTVTV